MAVFGLKYYAEMRSKYQGITWRCDITQRGRIRIVNTNTNRLVQDNLWEDGFYMTYR